MNMNMIMSTIIMRKTLTMMMIRLETERSWKAGQSQRARRAVRLDIRIGDFVTMMLINHHEMDIRIGNFIIIKILISMMTISVLW